MARNILQTRKLMRRRRLMMAMHWWLDILELTNLFMQIILRVIETECLRNERLLVHGYELNFYVKRSFLDKLIYTNDTICFEDFNASMSFALSQVPLSTNVGECSSKKRRRKNVDFVGDSITEAAVIISDWIKEATVEFSRAIGVDRLQAEKREKIKGVIEKFTGLSRLDRHKSMMIIARDHEMTDIFTLDENEKEDFVMALLRGDI